MDLLPAEQFVPEEIEAESDAVTRREGPANTLLQTGLSLPDFDLEPHEDRTELSRSVEDLEIAPASPTTTSLLVTASFVDAFFTSNQFIDTSPRLPTSPSPPLPSPAPSFRSPISQLGSGVGSGSGQAYNVTGAELPQSNVGSGPSATSSFPAWMMGEGEGGGLASASTSAPVIGTGGPPSTATGPCGASASGTGSISSSASGYVTVSGGSAFESKGEIKFSITFSGYAPCGFTVDYSTSDGDAFSDLTNPAEYDYTHTSDSVSFSGGSETIEVTVGVDNDAFPEFDETFTLTLDSVHDGSGGAVGNIDIGYGAGSGSGSGSGSSLGESATGEILNDDYVVDWDVSGTAHEGGAAAKLEIDVWPSPIRHSFGIQYDVSPNPLTPGSGATSSDIANASGSVQIGNNISGPITVNLIAADDPTIEATESFLVQLQAVVGSGAGSPDSLVIQGPTESNFDVIDNEWRWIGNSTVVDSQAGVATVLNMGVSVLTGLYGVDTFKADPGSPYGPNSVSVSTLGVFNDMGFGLGKTGKVNITTLQQTQARKFECDPATGDITEVSGNTNPGGGSTSGNLSVVSALSPPNISASSSGTLKTVTIYASGDVGVYGSHTVTAGGSGGGVSIGFEEQSVWSKNLGPWESTAVLQCRKGS
ncbi:MAG: hypothetical protein O3C40_25260 [Planctomycetota bacterium]|nr:hypothetical protein [Planctomycetota bacterium]